LAASLVAGVALGLLMIYGGGRALRHVFISCGTQYSSGFTWAKYEAVTKGQSRAEVNRILGTPYTHLFTRGIPADHKEFFYAIQKGNSWLSYWAAIEYDEHDSVCDKIWVVWVD